MDVFMLILGGLLSIFLLLLSIALFELNKADIDKKIKIAVKKETTKIIRQINKERMNY